MVSGQSGDIGARETARLCEEAKQEIGARIRALCKARGVSRRGLATMTGLGIGTVMDVVAGRSDPTLSTLLAVAGALDVGTIEDLLGPTATENLIAAQGRAERRAQVA